jgi:integrase
MAMTITEGFRRHTKVMRAGGVSGLDPKVREKAYGMLEADLRSALGVKGPKPAEGTTVIMPAVEASGYDGTFASEDDFLPPQDDPWILANADTDGLSEEERFDLHLIKMFELNTLAFRSEFARYLEACQRLGRDPMKETPVLEMALTETLETAQSFGLTQPPTTASASNETHQAKLPVEKTPLFSVFAETYLNYRCQGYQFQKEDEAPHLPTGKSFERNSFRNWKASVRIFTEIVGDLRLGEITKQEVFEFNTMIQRLPSNFGKSSRDTRTARQVIEDLDETEELNLASLEEAERLKGTLPGEIEDKLAKARAKRIGSRTIQRHQLALNAMLKQAHTQGLMVKNPFQGHVLTDKEVTDRQKSERTVERKGWGDDIYSLFRSAIYQQPLDDETDPLFWAPLIAVYAGLRLEEACQLRVNDFDHEDGVAFLSVQNAIGSQNYKSPNSLRSVPLHRALIDLGLLHLVELRRRDGMSRLFPQIARSKSKGTLSAIMSKRFGYYVQSKEIKKAEARLDFHALRTEFQTRLTRQKVPEHVRKYLMGHEQNDITYKSYYRAGETIISLADDVNKNDIKHSMILPPFGKLFLTDQPKLRVVENVRASQV